MQILACQPQRAANGNAFPKLITMDMCVHEYLSVLLFIFSLVLRERSHRGELPLNVSCLEWWEQWHYNIFYISSPALSWHILMSCLLHAWVLSRHFVIDSLRKIEVFLLNGCHPAKRHARNIFQYVFFNSYFVCYHITDFASFLIIFVPIPKHCCVSFLLILHLWLISYRAVSGYWGITLFAFCCYQMLGFFVWFLNDGRPFLHNLCFYFLLFCQIHLQWMKIESWG